MPGPSPALAAVQPVVLATARRNAWSPSDVDDIVQQSLWAYHCATRRRSPPRSPNALARTITRREVQRYYKRNLKVYRKHGVVHKRAEAHVVTVPLTEELAECSTHQLDLLILDDYFGTLERTHGRSARLLAEHLVQKQWTLREVAAEWRPLLKEVQHFTRRWLTK